MSVWKQLSRSLDKIGGVVAARRIPYFLVKRLSRNPRRSVLWTWMRCFYSKPSSIFNFAGFIPLPIQHVSYKDFRHVVHHPVRDFPANEFPKSLEVESEWTRWTSELPAALRAPTIRSCHTVSIPHGFADAGGNVFNNEGCLVIGASLPVQHGVDEYYKPSTIFPRIFRGENVGVVTTSLQSNYYHWLMDVLPRIHMLRSQEVVPTQVYLQIKNPFQIDTTQLLGLDKAAIINTEDYPFARATNLVVPFHEIKSLLEHPAWVCEFLRSTFIPLADRHPSGSTAKRIYISREGARWRRVVNEPEVLNALEPYGFIKVNLDGMRVLEQVKLFAGAEVVIAPHGAGLTNLVFAQPGTKVIEFQPWKLQDSFFRLSKAVGLDHYYLKSLDGPASPVNNHQQLTVSTTELKDLMRIASIQ